MNIADQLEKLHQLLQSGAISEEEYTQAKAKLLGAAANGPEVVTAPADVEQQTRQWAMFLHLSQLANCVLPLAGMIVPLVIWQIKKTELPGIDAHGKIVANWIISLLIYFPACVVASVIVIGIPALLALMIVAVVFPIIGGIKASNGEVWKYPLSIQFFN